MFEPVRGQAHCIQVTAVGVKSGREYGQVRLQFYSNTLKIFRLIEYSEVFYKNRSLQTWEGMASTSSGLNSTSLTFRLVVTGLIVKNKGDRRMKRKKNDRDIGKKLGPL